MPGRIWTRLQGFGEFYELIKPNRNSLKIWICGISGVQKARFVMRTPPLPWRQVAAAETQARKLAEADSLVVQTTGLGAGQQLQEMTRIL
ncbi:hypothetical protein GOODEAATRI_026274 [Goodea atripinnis]|uniref:Uncharacterized protein n=1 Tax=Goodea atripinnis TaxID=208336 RepID=A0ABV0P7X0_9TELE